MNQSNSARPSGFPAGPQASTPPGLTGGRFLSTYGANAQVDAQRIVSPERASADGHVTPGIDTGRSTLSPLPASPTPPDNNKAGGAGDFYPDPPTPEEVAEAFRFKYGI